MVLQLRQTELSAKMVYGRVKTILLSAHAQNHVSLEWCHKSFATIMLCNHNFLLMASNLSNLTAFRVIFSHVFTAHVQKQLVMNFQRKF